VKKPSDAELLAHIGSQPWFVEATQRRCAMELLQLSEAAASFRERCLDWGRDTEELWREFEALTDGAHAPAQRQNSVNLRQCAARLQARVANARAEFIQGPYRYLLPPAAVVEYCDAELLEYHTQVCGQVDRLVHPITSGYLESLTRLTKACAVSQNEENPS